MPPLHSDLSERLRQHAVTNRKPSTLRVPFAQLARLVGVSRRTVYNAITGTVSPGTEVLFSRILEMIEAGEFRFERRKQRWCASGLPPLIIRPRRRPYTRRNSRGDSTILPMTREGLIRKLHNLEMAGRCLQEIACLAGLPYQTVRQATTGLLSENTRVQLEDTLAHLS